MLNEIGFAKQLLGPQGCWGQKPRSHQAVTEPASAISRFGPRVGFGRARSPTGPGIIRWRRSSSSASSSAGSIRPAAALAAVACTWSSSSSTTSAARRSCLSRRSRRRRLSVAALTSPASAAGATAAKNCSSRVGTSLPRQPGACGGALAARHRESPTRSRSRATASPVGVVPGSHRHARRSFKVHRCIPPYSGCMRPAHPLTCDVCGNGLPRTGESRATGVPWAGRRWARATNGAAPRGLVSISLSVPMIDTSAI